MSNHASALNTGSTSFSLSHLTKSLPWWGVSRALNMSPLGVFPSHPKRAVHWHLSGGDRLNCGLQERGHNFFKGFPKTSGVSLLASMGPFLVNNNPKAECLYCHPILGSALHLSKACLHPRWDCSLLNAHTDERPMSLSCSCPEFPSIKWGHWTQSFLKFFQISNPITIWLHEIPSSLEYIDSG